MKIGIEKKDKKKESSRQNNTPKTRTRCNEFTSFFLKSILYFIEKREAHLTKISKTKIKNLAYSTHNPLQPKVYALYYSLLLFTAEVFLDIHLFLH